jgi:hypothetical protein
VISETCILNMQAKLKFVLVDLISPELSHIGIQLDLASTLEAAHWKVSTFSCTLYMYHSVPCTKGCLAMSVSSSR